MSLAAANRKKNSAKIILACAVVIVIILALSKFNILNGYMQQIIMSMCVNIIFAASLNIVNGFMGEFSCGHAGFMAVGAYTSSVLSLMLFTENKFVGSPLLPPWTSLFLFPVPIILGGFFAAAFGLLVAIPSFKTRDDYLAIITIASNFIITTLIYNLKVVGGTSGLMGMKNTIFAMTDVVSFPWMLLYMMLFTILCVVLIQRLMASTLGKGISAIRYDEISAEIMSVNTDRMKLLAFCFSSGIAGVAGGLYAHMIGFINHNTFNIMKSTEGMVMVYLGGMGSISGSVMSAVFFTFLLELMRPFQIFKWVLIPLLLILLMQFRPEGLMGNKELPYIWKKWQEKKAAKKAAAGGAT
jgi:branched-chain amino acid transport system permease protein